MRDARCRPHAHLQDPSGDYQTLQEFIPEARKKLNSNTWGYLVGATETEATMRRNRMALDSIAFRPRVCRDASKVDTSTAFLNMALRIPVMLAPVGSLELIDLGGGATAGRGASAFGVPIIVSSVTKPGLEEIAKATPGPKIFQLYVRGDDAWVDAVVARAIDAGYDAFCITVDTAAYSRRERDMVARFVKPWRAAATGHEFQASFDWGNVRRFKAKHAVPLILKGIATAEDAATAVACGVDVVYVSNHGGRQPKPRPRRDGRAARGAGGSRRPGARGHRRRFRARHRRGEGDRAGRRRGGDGADVLLRPGRRRRSRRVSRAGDLFEQEIAVAMALLGATSLGEPGSVVSAFRRTGGDAAARA